jgi:hypothetical protein
MIVATAPGALGAVVFSAPAFVAVCLVAIAAEMVVTLPAAVTARARAYASSARLMEVFSEDAALPAARTEIDFATGRCHAAG